MRNEIDERKRFFKHNDFALLKTPLSDVPSRYDNCKSYIMVSRCPNNPAAWCFTATTREMILLWLQTITPRTKDSRKEMQTIMVSGVIFEQ
jgi:hypothetical protein